MEYLNTEYQIYYLEDLDTLITCNHHYLLLKAFDKCVVFYFWKATESRNVSVLISYRYSPIVNIL